MGRTSCIAAVGTGEQQDWVRTEDDFIRNIYENTNELSLYIRLDNYISSPISVVITSMVSVIHKINCDVKITDDSRKNKFLSLKSLTTLNGIKKSSAILLYPKHNNPSSCLVDPVCANCQLAAGCLHTLQSGCYIGSPVGGRGGCFSLTLFF